MEKQFLSCGVAGCSGNAHHNGNGRRGLCSTHYQRLKRHGDTHTVKQTPSKAKDWLIAHIGHDGSDCLLWPFAIGKDGYGRVHSFLTGKLTTASRQMCVAAHGDPPTSRHEAAHKCGNGKGGCVNPQHLYWALPATNQADRIAHGTTNRGARHGMAKLTEANVSEIRQLLEAHSQAEIAASFGVDPSHISCIKSRTRWAWLD